MPTKPTTPDELEFLTEFGERLKLSLDRRQITQNQFAKSIGVSRARINQVIKGCPKSPIGIILLNKIVRKLNISSNYLLGHVVKK